MQSQNGQHSNPSMLTVYIYMYMCSYLHVHVHVPYSWKIWRFGGMCLSTAKFFRVYMYMYAPMAIPYHTAKFKV